MKRHLAAGLVLAVLGSSGCIRFKHSDDDEKPLGPEITDSSVAGQYALADSQCQSSEDDMALDVSAWQFDGSKTSSQTGFQAKSSATYGLSGEIISSSYYGLHWRQTCAKSGSSVKCDKGTLVSEPRPLKICKSGQNFPQTSYEGIGITSLEHIEAAAKFYRTLEGSDKDMERANLFVIPLVEKVLKSSSGGNAASEFQSDNLAYVANYAGAPGFLIFPKGAASVELGIWKNLNLWEAPWTLAHEFGHHVLRTHTDVENFDDLSSLTNEKRALQIRQREGLIQLPEINRRSTEKEAIIEKDSAGGRVVDRNLIWDGMNEGFADLFSFYARGSQPGQSKGIDCFAHNRDIDEDLFADSQPKALTDDVMEQFLSLSKGPSSRDCSKPNFQDIHIIGAIIARGVDQLFAAKVGSAADASAAKGALLLQWAGRLKKVATQSSFTLADLVVPALAVAAEGESKLTKAQCEIVKKSFPFYADRWVGEGGKFTCN